MRTALAGAAVAALMLQMSAAVARPPTVTNSPGYEARLAEQRKATAERRALEIKQQGEKQKGAKSTTTPGR